MTNKNRIVIYTGIKHDLQRRSNEHKKKEGFSYTKRYKLTKSIFYKSFSRIDDAIAVEKKIKASSRTKKIELI